jgi:hypothetical protein
MGILNHVSHLCSFTDTKEALKLRKKRPLNVRIQSSSCFDLCSNKSRR